MKGLQPRIILHVGLHKTGTTYLQKRVFTQFDKSSVVYNPEKLRKSIRELYGLKLKTELLSKYQEIVKSEIIKIDKEILFLSHEIYSGTPWTNYDDIEIMTDFLSQAFPTAEIILVFREHADWLESLYRESAKDGNLVSMNRFLNYKRGCFSSRSLTPYKNVNALDFQYDLIENLFHRKFHKIHLLFFEELRDKPENFFAKLEQITKSKLRLVKQVKENRSYSALTI
jgi:hypothetical protein